MKGPRLLLFFGIGLLAAVFVVGIYIVPRTQTGNSRTPSQSDAGRVPFGDVYLDVTYATPQFIHRVKLGPYLDRYRGRVQPFLVGVNTHVGSVEHLDLEGKVQLEDSHGDRYPSIGAPVVVSEHHNLYLICFPLLDNYGQPIFAANRDHFRLLFAGIGRTPERVFEWKLPVIEPTPARTLANTLAMALGVLGALMVILSPCAIELTTYYTGIIAGVTSSAILAHGPEATDLGAARQPLSNLQPPTPNIPLSSHPAFRQSNRQQQTSNPSKAPPAVRRRILKNLAGFVAGFTLLYMISGAMVAWLGQSLISGSGAIRPLIEAICGSSLRGAPGGTSSPTSAASGHMAHGLLGQWGHYMNWLGAAFLVFFALRSLGLFKRSASCLVWLGKLGRRIRFGIAWLVGLVSPKRAQIIRQPCLSVRVPANITPLNSFCAGLGLSVSCLTCMGGAILYPLLIFVGTSSWYWGALILGTYSIALAVPMAAIAVSVGDFAWKYAHNLWLVRGLQWTGAAVMICVAVLVAFERTRLINTVVFSVLSAIGGGSHSSLAQL
jgi:cytochrome c biogenesis protein CcdA